jgi:hypothetical protein
MTGAYIRANQQRRFSMKTFAPIIVLVAGLISAQGASATVTPTDAELKACFQAHSQQMEKPGLKNWVTCWHAHGALMERS